MNQWISSTKYIIFTLFLVSSAAAAAYEWWYVWPVKKCDQTGAWWDARDRECLAPIPIWRVTGRLPGEAPAKTAPSKG